MQGKRPRHGVKAWQRNYRIADAADAKYDEIRLFLAVSVHRALYESDPARDLACDGRQHVVSP